MDSVLEIRQFPCPTAPYHAPGLIGINLTAEDYWSENPDHALADWQAEVANGDTRLGYHVWAAARAA